MTSTRPVRGLGWRLAQGQRETPLLAARRALGLRQSDLATLAGVSQRSVQRVEWLRDLARVPLGDLVRIAGAIGAAPTELVPGLTQRPEVPLLRGAGLALAKRLAREFRGPLRPGMVGPDRPDSGPLAEARSS